ncbi:MAG: MFS transporter [Alphaproteobacteria bacterium]|nr:MFS transporter [Alphaproteobacteria bacterium]
MAQAPELFSEETFKAVESALWPRRVALSLLINVLDKNHTLDDTLESSADFSRLQQRDRAFVRMLVTTTLRRLGQIDDLIAHALAKPDEEIKPQALLHILRLGVTQLVFMNTADFAAVDTSVELANASGLSRQKGFVNGVLRTIGREGKSWTSAQDIPRLITPDWLLRSWIMDYGLPQSLAIANAHLQEAALDITPSNPAEAASLAEILQGLVLPSGNIRVLEPEGRVETLPGFKEGAWWVQDAASALPAKLFGTISGEHVIDLCAAPGGKTAQLVAMGANVTAIDRSTSRLKRLHENIKRLNFTSRVDVVCVDAASWRPKTLVRHVLVDAPCSATGTLRRHPDLAWLKGERDVENLIQVQRKLIDNALSMLERGGTLIYCTCSLQKSEGEAHFQNLNGAYIKPIERSEVPGLEQAVTPEGFLRITPAMWADKGGIDGFFIARLVKE